MILIIKAPVASSMPRYMYRLLSSPVFGFGTGGFSVLGSGSLGAGGINLSFNMVNPLSALPSYETLKRLSPDSK